MQIWNLLDNKFQMKDIIDYRFGESDKPSREEIRERTLQIILDEEVDPLSSPLMNEFNITLQLPNMEFISLKVVKVL